MVETGLKFRPSKETHMHELQRLASIGWRQILNAWDAALGQKTIGELLLTQKELGLKHEREEVLRVTHALLSHDDIAVANENDAITHEEIAFGDNDTLAAAFAAKLRHSSLFGNNVRLVLLSDIDGVYADVGEASSVISTIENITAHEHLAQGAINSSGTGGMITKFTAARIANENGIDMWIANGRVEDAIERTLKGELGTRFLA
jgi:glutamate 5-kinase